MKNKTLILVVTAALFGLLCSPAPASARTDACYLRGYVKDSVTSQPIEGATIKATNIGLVTVTATSDADGYYTMTLDADYDSGTWYNVRVTKSRYAEYTTEVTLYGAIGDNPNERIQNVNMDPLPTPTVETWTNVQTDVFSVDDPEYPVYVMGDYYDPSTTYQVYIVLDTTWVNGMTIPARVPGTSTSITSSPWGTLGIPSPQRVWMVPLTPGAYDIVIDVNGNGVYDEGVDALDDNDVGSAGFIVTPSFVIPEAPFGVVGLMLTMLAAAVLTQRRGFALKL